MQKLFTYTTTLVFTLLLASTAAMAQFTVTGTVTDEKGEPMVGVTVVVKNTTVGTVSDLDGNYSLKVPGSSATLTFSSVGYEISEQSVSSSTGRLDVALEPSVTRLEEVVISGLATSVARRNLANAVSTVSSKELTGVTAPQTVDAALYGKFTGVVINANSGAPGGGIGVRLRGLTSINGNAQPLYIIDGVFMDNSSTPAGLNAISQAAAGGSASNQDNPSNRLADLNPDDIESIEILKGASAAALYGSRAATGVIIITTKRGKPGENMVNFSQTLGVATQLKKLGVRNFDAEKVEASFGASQVPVFEAAQAAGKIFNYEDELYGNKGLLSTTNLSLSGGNQTTQYYFGTTYKNEEGIVKNTGYEKLSLRLNLDHKLSERINLGFSNMYTLSSADRGFFNNDNTNTTMGVAYAATPAWADLFPDENGNYPNNPYTASNFLQTRDLITNNEKVNRYIGGANLTLKIYQTETATLQFIGRAGIDRYTLNTKALFPRTLQFQKDGNGTNGASIQGSATNNNANFNGFFVHSFFLPSGVSFRTQFGGTREEFRFNNILVTATELIGSQENVDQSGAVSVEQTRRNQTDMGFFVQEEVNWDDKVIATLGLRGDKSSNNGDPNQLYYYPKASLALNLHEFGFLPDKLSQLKLRAAFGQAGNFARFGSTFTSLGNTIIDGNAGSLINTLRGNNEVGPERQTEIETGFDLGFNRGRYALDFTYYVKSVADLLINVNVPTTSGFTTRVTNAADLRNNGIEVGLTLQPISNRNFNWYSRTAFWLNRSEITRLDVPAFNLGAFGATLGTFRIEEGKSATQIVGISPNGVVAFGDAEPDFQMSFQNTLNYKDLELSFLIHWKQGGDNINLSTLLTDIYGTSPDFDDTDLDPNGELTNGNYRLNSLGTTAQAWIEDASYVRLREIGLFYNFRNLFDGKVKNLRLGVSGNNLLNFFQYNSYDPEVSNFGSDGFSSNVEVLPFPSAKRFFGHLSVSF
ncbi:SusC/RagA family TonB-linked outer membrane protein [Sphingobacteriales bacterium TSM_CSS]|nr:SusC/RagA family TonB-linked outer membrane protein [Sphingobacteriales bacterium TSM_CSS]